MDVDKEIRKQNKIEECDEAERWDLSQLNKRQHPQQLEQRLAESLEDEASVCHATNLVFLPGEITV